MTERDIKRNLNKRVRYTNRRLHIENAEYILSGAMIRLGDSGFYYQAELTDVRGEKSVVICKLEEIESFSPRGENI